MDLDPISVFRSLASIIYSRGKYSSCDRLCDNDLAAIGAPGCSKGYRTRCCDRMFCDKHIRAWAEGVERNGGNCPYCQLSVTGKPDRAFTEFIARGGLDIEE